MIIYNDIIIISYNNIMFDYFTIIRMGAAAQGVQPAAQQHLRLRFQRRRRHVRLRHRLRLVKGTTGQTRNWSNT